MGLVRAGERMKRARRRMAAAEMAARTERKRRVPSMVVAFAVLAVWEREVGGVVYLKVGERRGKAERGRGIGYVPEATLVSKGEDSCLSRTPALGGRDGRWLLVYLSTGMHTAIRNIFPLHDDARSHSAETPDCGADRQRQVLRWDQL